MRNDTVITPEWKQQLLSGGVTQDDEYQLVISFKPEKKGMFRVVLAAKRVSDGLAGTEYVSDPININDTLTFIDMRNMFQITIT